MFALPIVMASGQGTTFIYDQQSADESTISGASATIQTAQPIGQSFTPAFSSVEFVRFRFYDPDPGNSVGAIVYINLRANSITGTILGTSSAVSMPDGFGGGVIGVTNFFFPSAIAVTPGTVYFFQPIKQSGDANWGIVGYNTYNYAGGTAFFNGTASSSDDLWFREGLAIVPEPSTIGLGIFGAATIFILRRSRAKKAAV